jgi:hypothetical protein
MLSRRLLVGALAAIGVSAFLLSRGFHDLDRRRAKLVEVATPAVAGSVLVTRSDLGDLASLDQPLALILRTRNEAPAQQRFTVTADGAHICTYVVAARRTERTDCVVRLAGRALPHTFQVTAAEGSWTLDYLEVATHHGNSSGPIYLVILPRGSTLGSRPSVLFVIALALAVLSASLLSPVRRLPRWAARTHVLAIGVLGTVALAILIAPWLTPYRIVLSEWTVLAWLAVIGARQLGTCVRWISAANTGGRGVAAPFARASVVALLVLTVFWQPVRHRLVEYAGNYSGFLMISERAFSVNPLVKDRDDLRQQLRLLDNGGYDGQFMYFVAFDPFMREFRDRPRAYRDVVDAVPYRFGRIGFSALTRAAALGHSERYPVVMIWILLLSLAATSFGLSVIAQHHGRSAWYGALILAVPGFWQSIQSALPEPLAAATLVAGLACVIRRQLMPAGLLFAASLLVRETGVVLVLCVAVGLFMGTRGGGPDNPRDASPKGRRREALAFAALDFPASSITRPI